MDFNLPLYGSIDIKKTEDLFIDTGNSLLLVIGGTKNTRIMATNLGCSLDRYLFENQIDIKQIRSIIESEVYRLIPSVKIYDITENKNIPGGENKINLIIKWGIPSVSKDRIETLSIISK